MNKLTARRVSTAAAAGGALGAWYAAFAFAVAETFTISLIGFRTDNPLLALVISGAGGAVLAIALLALESVLFDRDGIVPEAIQWTGRVISSRREILWRAAGVAFLLGMFPFVGLFTALVVSAVAMPLLLLHRGRLSGEPEQFVSDAGGLGCLTVVVVIVLGTVGRWIEKGFDWVMAHIETPPVVDNIGTTSWSLAGTIGTLVLATVILERAEFEDVRPLLKRFLRWRALGIAIALEVRLTAIVGLIVFPVAAIAVAAFRATGYETRTLEPLPFAAIVGVLGSLVVPAAMGSCTLIIGRTLVHLFPEPLRWAPALLQPRHEEPPQQMPVTT